jgi:hypothetical protein
MKGSILLALLTVLGACTSDADVAGNYTVALTNRDNGCNLGNFNSGGTSTGVGVVITQNGSKLTLTVNGLGGVALIALLGGDGNVMTGSVDGDDFEVEALGTRANNMGNCTFTYNSTISGTLHGDALEGVIEYTVSDNGNSDCAQVHGCLSYQDYNGTRPPQ